MRYIPIFGLIAGAVVALGRMSAAQLHTVGLALLSLAQAYGLAVLPWALAVLFAWRWWHQKQLARIWYQSWSEEIAINSRSRAMQQAEQQRRPAARRKRATR